MAWVQVLSRFCVDEKVDLYVFLIIPNFTGVATYVKESATPIKCEEGLSGLLSTDNSEQNIGCYGNQGNFTDESLKNLDNEGRTIITQHRVM